MTEETAPPGATENDPEQKTTTIRMECRVIANPVFREAAAVLTRAINELFLRADQGDRQNLIPVWRGRELVRARDALLAQADDDARIVGSSWVHVPPPAASEQPAAGAPETPVAAGEKALSADPKVPHAE